MTDLWLGGASEGKTAERFGIARATVRHHVDKTIRPIWQDGMRSRLADDLAKVALIERTTWERFHGAEPGETRETIEKARIHGYYAPKWHHMDTGGGLRLAGETPVETDQRMFRLLLERIEERRRLRAALDAELS